MRILVVTLARPSLSIHPRDDEVFRRAVFAFADHGQVETPHGLQERLRDAYPDAIVRPRSIGDGRVEIWHVYRDGWPAPAGELAGRLSLSSFSHSRRG